MTPVDILWFGIVSKLSNFVLVLCSKLLNRTALYNKYICSRVDRCPLPLVNRTLVNAVAISRSVQ